jgi:hypothetical protein
MRGVKDKLESFYPVCQVVLAFVKCEIVPEPDLVCGLLLVCTGPNMGSYFPAAADKRLGEFNRGEAKS